MTGPSSSLAGEIDRRGCPSSSLGSRAPVFRGPSGPIVIRWPSSSLAAVTWRGRLSSSLGGRVTPYRGQPAPS